MPAPEVERRKVERVSIARPARLRPNEWSLVNVEVLDLSSAGFRATGDLQLRQGSYLALEVPGIGTVDAKVVWQQSRHFGAQFLRPLPLAHCAWTNPPVEVMPLPDAQTRLTPPRLAEFLAAYVDSRSSRRRSSPRR
ncbi:MAG: hypothetical protein JWP15_1766 [Alphaproteobacteria bacterium]|nr:hypothetical protein [Alphaproteobacteria bacterium]